MILLLAVAIPALLGVVVIGAALAQRQRELSLGADIAALRRRAARATYRLPAAANDTYPVVAAKIRRRADRSFRR
ncbi:MAG TPA: hypothetical protein VMH36_20985 [Alphaproteobacteria bacterium]|nr:hypothetical protein [Alphaproteobacteria bacterium]